MRSASDDLLSYNKTVTLYSRVPSHGGKPGTAILLDMSEKLCDALTHK